MRALIIACLDVHLHHVSFSPDIGQTSGHGVWKFVVQSTSDSKQIAATDLDALQHHAGQNNIYRGVLKNLLTKPLEPANEHLLTG